VLNEVLTARVLTINRAKISCPDLSHVTDCDPRIFNFFDSFAGDYGVHHPYFPLKVRGGEIEGMRRGLRRAMVDTEPVIDECLQAECAELAARLRCAPLRLEKAPVMGAFLFGRAQQEAPETRFQAEHGLAPVR
jgi:hypothetical protein